MLLQDSGQCSKNYARRIVRFPPKERYGVIFAAGWPQNAYFPSGAHSVSGRPQNGSHRSATNRPAADRQRLQAGVQTQKNQLPKELVFCFAAGGYRTVILAINGLPLRERPSCRIFSTMMRFSGLSFSGGRLTSPSAS